MSALLGFVPVVASLVLALTFMPAVASIVFKKGVAEKETWLLARLKRLYVPALSFTMRRRVLPAGLAVLAFGGAAATLPFLGAEFIPRLDEGAAQRADGVARAFGACSRAAA